MRRLLSLLLTLSFMAAAFAQLPKTTNSTALTKVIKVKEYQGWYFSASLDIKAVPSDSSGMAGAAMLQVGKKDWDFIKNTGSSAAVKKEAGWQQISLNGQIDSETDKLWIYLMTSGNGDFYFDNIQLKVRKQDGNWQDVTVNGGDFDNIADPLSDLKNSTSLKKVKGSYAVLKQDSDPAHNKILHVHTEGGVADTAVYYGYNYAAGHHVRCNGTVIYYESYGQGEPLLLLHGNGGSISSFSAIIPQLAKHFRVIAVDTRAQGKSPDSGPQYFSYELFAADMKTLLDTLQLKNVNVIGWSDGGNTGLLLASRHPDYVSRLVTMGANLNPSDTSVKKSILNKAKKDLQSLERKNNPSDSTNIKLMRLILQEPHIEPSSLNAITARTMIMAGEKDLVLERHSKLIAENIPGAELNILKGQTHWVVTENPELFSREVLSFLLKKPR
jgi:pimeloyl-ACP methyl ester carboxylesterase